MATEIAISFVLIGIFVIALIFSIVHWDEVNYQELEQDVDDLARDIEKKAGTRNE